jgi:hypothetical protein
MNLCLYWVQELPCHSSGSMGASHPAGLRISFKEASATLAMLKLHIPLLDASIMEKDASILVISLGHKVVGQEDLYLANGLICCLNGFWPQLTNLHIWVSWLWKTSLWGEAYIPVTTQSCMWMDLQLSLQR